METALYNKFGEHVGNITLRDDIFGIEPNVAVMHQAMIRQRANARRGTHSTLTRGEVRGSTRKLFRQKGTGRARQGANRAIHRRGGGIAHGPKPRSYEKKMPKKMRRLAVRSALSAKYSAEQIRFVDMLEMDEPRTKDMVSILHAHQAEGKKTLIVLDQKNENVQRSANNLPYVKTLLAHYLNVIDLLHFDTIIISKPAVDVVEGYLATTQHRTPEPEESPAEA
jgi:large subunit ribosomal protein L4